MKSKTIAGAAIIAVSLAACSAPAENTAAVTTPSPSTAVSETQRQVERAIQTGWDQLPVTCEDKSLAGTKDRISEWLTAEYPTIGDVSSAEIEGALDIICEDVPPPTAEEVAVATLVRTLERQSNLDERCEIFAMRDDFVAMFLIEAASDAGLVPATTSVDAGIEAYGLACS